MPAKNSEAEKDKMDRLGGGGKLQQLISIFSQAELTRLRRTGKKRGIRRIEVLKRSETIFGTRMFNGSSD